MEKKLAVVKNYFKIKEIKVNMQFIKEIFSCIYHLELN